MKEFGFYSDDLKYALGDDIAICSSGEFLISNSKELKAQIYAPEIDIYLKHTLASAQVVANSVRILYEARAVAFDGGLDVCKQKNVGKNIIGINLDRQISSCLIKDGYKIINLTHDEVKFLYGEVGELVVLLDDDSEVCCDFVLVCSAKEYMLRQSGVYEVFGLNGGEILDLLEGKTPIYEYKNSITYDRSLCQYAGRFRGEICAACADVCQRVAILKNDEIKELEFSPIDCISCGACVSACLSGAIEFAPLPRSVFDKIARLYEGKIPLLIREKELGDIKFNLKAEVLPFVVPNLGFMDEIYLLSLLQECASEVVIYAPNKIFSTLNAELINQIYTSTPIKIATNLKELEEELNIAKTDERFKFNLMGEYKNKKEIFFHRAQHALKSSEFSSVKLKNLPPNYGKVAVNESSCTLCLACAGACNMGALKAHETKTALVFNSALCTACGHCALSCAQEDTLSVIGGEFELKDESFAYQILAEDELFECEVCGAEFATKKAVNRVAQMMQKSFMGDELKLKTLYMCAQCKAKTMLKAQNEI